MGYTLNQAGGVVNIYHPGVGGEVYNASTPICMEHCMYMPTANGVVYNAATKISTEFYNLFVIGGEEFKDNFFVIDKECALTIAEDVEVGISARFAALTPESVATIKTFPSVFASENRRYGGTDADHFAFYGMVTGVRIQENGIKIYYQKFSAVSQQRLNEIAPNLAIKGTSSTNEFDRTHWTIKRINLVAELRAAGISVLAPT